MLPILGHKFYEEREALRRGLSKDKKTWTPDQMRAYDSLNAQMKELYAPAWNLASSFVKSLADTSIPFRIADSTGNSRGGDSSQAMQPGNSGWPTVMGIPSTFIKIQRPFSITSPLDSASVPQESPFRVAERALFAVRKELRKLVPGLKPRIRVAKSTSIEALRASMAITKAQILLGKAQQRYPSGTPGGLGGQFMPTGRAGGGAGAGAVPARPDISRWRQDHPKVRLSNNRLDALQRLAQAGDIEAIRCFPAQGVHPYSRVVADYRATLLQHFEPAARLARARGTMPQAPDITGANMQNSSLLSARRHVERLTFIAQNAPDPGLALAAFSVTAGGRTNGYLSVAHSYHQGLIAHFAQGEGVAPTAPTAAAPRPATAPAQPAAASVFGVSSAPKTNGIAVGYFDDVTSLGVYGPSDLDIAVGLVHTQPFNSAIGVQNIAFAGGGTIMTHIGQVAVDPAFASNPQRISVNDLGFIPRPAIPLDAVVRVAGIDARGQITPWSSTAAQRLATAYLAQPVGLQTRARNYQAGTWVPDTPEARARAAAEQQQRDIASQEATRLAVQQETARRSAIPAEWLPRSTIGANVTSAIVSGLPNSLLPTSAFQSAGKAKEFAKRLIADYGGGVQFTASVNIGTNTADVTFSGRDGTSIRRTFSDNGNGGINVYHAYFQAGSRGNSSGKRFFRVAFGEYQAMGVKEVGVTANIDVGGYAWARYGFLPKNDGVWQSLGATIRSNASRALAAGTITQDAHDKVQLLANAPDKRNLWKIADLEENGQSVGKKMLMHTGWSGVIDMGNAEQMERFTLYVSDENIARGTSHNPTRS